MFANKFAEDYAGMRLEESHRRVARTPSPRDISQASSSSQHVCLDIPDPLANRVSFYMDDAVISSVDEGIDVSPALSRQPSSSKHHHHHHHHHHLQIPKELRPPKQSRRSRSFREPREEPRPRLYRHGSDIGPGAGRRSSQRSSGRSSTRSSRRSSRRQKSASPSASAVGERGGSVRSHHRGGSARRKASSTSLKLSPPPASASCSGGGFSFPHADLPPKERRRRTVVLIVVATFMFLLACSVLTVVVTLTHSSFHKSVVPHDVREGFQTEEAAANGLLRKENEELMSGITRIGNYNNSAPSSPQLDGSTTPEP